MFFIKKKNKMTKDQNHHEKQQELAEIVQKKSKQHEKVSSISDEIIAKAIKDLLLKE
ncbi:hypothetical protein QBE52_15815 [Clostridiaceae bacterium 35-E11]